MFTKAANWSDNRVWKKVELPWAAFLVPLRRPFLTTIHASVVLVLALALLTAAAQTAKADGPLDADVIKAALHTATPQEEGFIEYVVGRVEKGTLPRDLVHSTFLWARKKPEKKFYYFKQGLIVRAAAQGIKV